MEKHEEALEIRRKTVHVLTGTIIAMLLWLQTIDSFIISAISFLIMAFFLLIREFPYKTKFIFRALTFFEREKFIKNTPGKSVYFFFFGCSIASFFPLNIAVSSILILSFGDAVSCLVGHHFGRIKTPFHDKKHIEGSVLAIWLCTAISSYFVPWFPALVASSVAMILEFPDWRIGKHYIDDNFIIPISAGLTLTLLI